MLDQVRQRARKLIARGQTLEPAVAVKPTADRHAQIDGSDFIAPDKRARAAYTSSRANSSRPRRRRVSAPAKR